ncbi:MAG: hypothetical protein K0M55_11050 [Rhizobium sp.]|nr:hypothetical protein [Rhizobium sp.]
MRIAIIGTSNSVMTRGWANALKKISPEHWEIENLSLGASPSLYGSFIISKENIADNFDYALLDFTINDQQFLDISNLSLEYLAASYAGLLRHFATDEAVCTPICVFLPQRAFAQEGKNTDAYNICTRICDHYGIDYIDGFATVQRLAKGGIGVDEIFADWGHLTPEYQIVMAEKVLDFLTKAIPKKPRPEILMNAPKITAVPGGDIEYLNGEVRTLGTSFARHQVTSLREGGSGTIYNAPFLLGILHWIDEASGPVCFKGSDVNVSKALRKEWTKLFALTHFRKPVRSDGTIPFVFGEKQGYLLERGFGLAKTTQIAGDVADIVGFLKSDADPIAQGRLLLETLGASETGIA